MKKGLLFLLVLMLLGWGLVECKYSFSYWADLYQRPWAYSNDENTKLLVGHWEGSFTDPGGVTKTIKLEIFEPLTNEERLHKVSRRISKRRSISARENKQAFDGFALIKSRLGVEEYEVYGAVSKGDYHQFHFNFRPANEAKRILPNFTLLEARNGTWQDNSMNLTLSFSHHNADGNSSYSSEGIVKNGKIELQENQDDKKVSLSLTRQKL